MLQYSNPRTEAKFTDWPYGRLRTTCTFTVETTAKKGQRAVRVTVDPKTGRIGAPKALTYAKAVRIVDGDDGKTYIICLSMYGNINVFQSNMQFSEESFYPSDERFSELLKMFTD